MYARDEARIATPVGIVRVAGDDRTIDRIAIAPSGDEREGTAAAVIRATRQLREYFDGTRLAFDLPLADPATAFAGRMRGAMTAILYGGTATYGMLARAAGTAPRAAGQACARNPFPIVVPCHRVLSAGGSDHYSAGDGPATKQWLLAHERRNRRDP